jgi:hypothetical protein
VRLVAHGTEAVSVPLPTYCDCAHSALFAAEHLPSIRHVQFRNEPSDIHRTMPFKPSMDGAADCLLYLSAKDTSCVLYLSAMTHQH